MLALERGALLRATSSSWSQVPASELHALLARLSILFIFAARAATEHVATGTAAIENAATGTAAAEGDSAMNWLKI